MGALPWRIKGEKVLYACGQGRRRGERTAMGGHWVWWSAAAVLVGAELLTGTFYLLAVGIAAAFGGVAAWLDAGLPLQFLIAGGLGIVLTIAAHQWRKRRAPPPPQDSLDVGQAVQVRAWNP